MYIQMVTALVLQLIQCVVHLACDKDTLEEYESKVKRSKCIQACPDHESSPHLDLRTH